MYIETAPHKSKKPSSENNSSSFYSKVNKEVTVALELIIYSGKGQRSTKGLGQHSMAQGSLFFKLRLLFLNRF